MPFADKKKGAAWRKRWESKNRKRRLRYGRTSYRRHRREHIARCRRNFLQRQYGITEKQYAELLKKQGGVCAVCKKKQRSGRRLAVDHDHATAVVRGLLCQRCNCIADKFSTYLDSARVRT